MTNMGSLEEGYYYHMPAKNEAEIQEQGACQAEFDEFVANLRTRYAEISQEGYSYIDAIADVLEPLGYVIFMRENQDPRF